MTCLLTPPFCLETHCVEAHGGGPLPAVAQVLCLAEAAVCEAILQPGGASPALEHHGWYTRPELSGQWLFSVGRGVLPGLLHKVKTTFMVIPSHPLLQGVGQGSPEAG